MNTPLVSVVIPTYSRPTYLKRCVDSVLNQTYSNIEIFVVDDNNPDTEARAETEKTMAAYVDNTRVTYLQHDRNRNGSAARNTGWRASHGEYITFLDDDDVFYADHVEVLVNAIQKSNVKAVYSYGLETPIQIESVSPYRYKIIDYIGRYKEKFDVVKLAHHNFMPIQCVLFSRELYEKYGCMCVEMESFALFHNAKVLNKKAACILTISDSLVTQEETTPEERQNSFNKMIELALKSL